MNFEKSELHDRIEDFLDGRLSEVEKLEFLDHLKTDIELHRLYRQRITLGATWMKAKKYEETRHSVSQIIRTAKSDKKSQYFMWSAAASLLIILSVSGIVMFNRYPTTPSEIASTGQGTETQIVPYIKYAEEKASIHFKGELKMLAPIKSKLCYRNDSIVFAWNSDVDAETNLTIENQKSGKTVYREKVKVNAQKFIMEKNFLPEGEYQWFIEGFPGKEKFNVISNQNQK